MARLLLLLPLTSLLLSCGAVEHARTNERYPLSDPANLAPPIIDPVVRDCARAVHVRGFVPGALVQVWSNDFEEIGRAAPHFGDEDIAIYRPLDVEDILTATQTVDGVTSPHSPVPVLVETWPATLRAPVIEGDVWQCGRVVRLSGLEDSCRIDLFEDDSLRALAWSPGRVKGVVANTELRRRSRISAVQYACELDVEQKGPRKRQVSAEATAVEVKDFPGDDFPAPLVNVGSVRPGGDSVLVELLYVGAHINVLVNGVLAGEGLATDRSTRVALNKPLQAGSLVTAEQELCELSPASAPVVVEGELPAPELVGPICNDDPWVQVEYGALNATIAIVQGDRVVGTGGAQEGLSRIGVSGLIPGLPVAAVQYYGEVSMSQEGEPVRVCCCGAGCNEDLVALQEDDPDTWAAHSPASCKRSKNPLFDVEDYAVFELDITADWSAINGPTAAESTATLRYGAGDEVVSLPVTLAGRADERFDRCEYRPLQIEFERQQHGNAFAGHRRLALMTHCGDGDVSDEVDRRRLMMEYTLYKAFQAQDGAGLDVRLARVTYRDPDGSERRQAHAYFQEREHEACERCGWVRAVDDVAVRRALAAPPEPDLPSDADPLLADAAEPEAAPEVPLDPEAPPVAPADREPDPATRYAASLLDRLVTGTGSPQPPIACVDAARSAFFLPWDWDLADVVRDAPEYLERAPAFDDFLGASLPAVGTRVQAWHIAQHDAEMRQIITESPLDPIGRERLLAWYDLYMKTLKCFLGFK